MTILIPIVSRIYAPIAGLSNTLGETFLKPSFELSHIKRENTYFALTD